MANPKGTAKCMAEIVAAAGRPMSDDEVLFVMEQIRRNRRETRAAGKILKAEDEIFDNAREFARDLETAAAIEKRNALLHLVAKIEAESLAARADAQYGDPSLGLRALTGGINKPLLGGRLSAGARRGALQSEWLGGLIADLRRDDLLAHFNAGTYDREVARELAELSKGGEVGISGVPDAGRIAKIVDKYRRASVARENAAGAWIRLLPGYVARQTHDAHKMLVAGYDAWKASILPRLDAERTFQGADAEAFLRPTFDALVSGRHLKAEGAAESDLGLAFKGPGSLARKISEHRVLHFKDADAWYDYNMDFGARSLNGAVIADLERAARNVALMETFGPNPRALFEFMLETLKDRHRADPKKLARLNDGAIVHQFDEAEGLTRIAVNPTGAAVTSGVLALQSWSKLGGAALSSISDVATKAVTLNRYTEGGVLAAWGKAVGSFFEGLPAGEKARTAELIGVGLDGHLGAMASRFTADDTPPGQIARINRLYYKLNLLGPWTDANKRGVGLVLARDLAMKAERTFAELDPAAQRHLMGYGIAEPQWRALREAVEVQADGRAYLMPDRIATLPDVVFRHLTGGKQDARAIAKIKTELETRLRAYYADVAEEAIPTPGDRERALMLQGTRPGTYLGAAMRLVMQFKAFPVTMLAKQFGRAMEADTTAEFFKNLVAGRGDKAALAHLIAGTTIMGYVAMVAKDIAKNRSPRDPSDPKTFLAALVQGGGMGIYGDFVFGEYNRYGRSLLDTLAGPTLGTVSDVAELWARFRSGEDAAASTVRFLQSNTPFVNLFYTKGAFDFMVWHQLQEAANPGYLRRMEHNVARDQKQTFILPPSEAIPRGGALREAFR